jgi:hypothetical protein
MRFLTAYVPEFSPMGEFWYNFFDIKGHPLYFHTESECREFVSEKESEYFSSHFQKLEKSL